MSVFNENVDKFKRSSISLSGEHYTSISLSGEHKTSISLSGDCKTSISLTSEYKTSISLRLNRLRFASNRRIGIEVAGLIR